VRALFERMSQSLGLVSLRQLMEAWFKVHKVTPDKLFI
jgi:hypothetical protein